MADLLINFDDERDKRKLWALLRTRKGMQHVSVKRHRKVRSLSANAYMWAVVLPYAARAMTEAWGESFDAEQAHEFWKRKFLTRQVIDRSTGEVVGEITGSTGNLNTEQFADYLENIRKTCAEYLGVEIPLPNEQVAA